MRKTSIKYLVAGVLLGGAVIYLAAAGIQAASVYSVPVDRYLADSSLQSHRVRLHGKVAQDGLVSSPGRLSAQFSLLGKGQQINVAYTGMIPDLFKAGCDVVVEGKRDAAGTFQADVLMTKCASKYEPGSPHAQVANAPSAPTTPAAVAPEQTK